MDVVSHLPVYCEDHKILYVFVSSKRELGDAAKTKRPTSCVLIALESFTKSGLPKIVEKINGLDFGMAA